LYKNWLLLQNVATHRFSDKFEVTLLTFRLALSFNFKETFPGYKSVTISLYKQVNVVSFSHFFKDKIGKSLRFSRNRNANHCPWFTLIASMIARQIFSVAFKSNATRWE